MNKKPVCGLCGSLLQGAWVVQKGHTFCSSACADKAFPAQAGPKTPLGQAIFEWKSLTKTIANMLGSGTTREELLTHFKAHWSDVDYIVRLLRDPSVDTSEVKKS